MNLKAPESKHLKSLIIRFIKFNLIGFTVFLIATVVYFFAFPTFGIWTWLVANASGSVLQFGLINYFNKKEKGAIFDNQNPAQQETTK